MTKKPPVIHMMAECMRSSWRLPEYLKDRPVYDKDGRKITNKPKLIQRLCYSIPTDPDLVSEWPRVELPPEGEEAALPN